MNLLELRENIKASLKALMLPFEEFSLVKGVSIEFLVKDFGFLISIINGRDYSQVRDLAMKHFSSHRLMFITTSDEFEEKRYEILWELMRCGYFKWLRTTYPNRVKALLFGRENLARRIVEERLRIWGNKEKFKFLVEDNKMALNINSNIIYSEDPGFFDYMPTNYASDEILQEI